MLGFSKHLFLFCMAAMLLQVRVVHCLNFSPEKAGDDVLAQSYIDQKLSDLNSYSEREATQTFRQLSFNGQVACYWRALDNPYWKKLHAQIIAPIILALVPKIMLPHFKSNWEKYFDVIKRKSKLTVLGSLSDDGKTIYNPYIDIKTIYNPCIDIKKTVVDFERTDIDAVLAINFNTSKKKNSDYLLNDCFMAGLLKNTKDERPAFMLRSYFTKERKETVITVAPSWESLLNQMFSQDVYDVVKYSRWPDKKKDKIDKVFIRGGMSDVEALSSQNYENLRKYLANCKIAQCTYL